MGVTFNPLAPRPWKGIDALVLDRAGVVVERDRVTVPYREPDGSTRYRKVFSSSGRSWYSPRPSQVGGLIPGGLELLPIRDGRADTIEGAAVLLAEGESDALALREAFGWWERYPAGVYVLAIPGASSWSPSWVDYLRRFAVVYVAFDGDDAGRRGACRVRHAVRWARLVELPDGHDARGLLQAGRLDVVLAAIAGADRLHRLDLAIRLGDLRPFYDLARRPDSAAPTAPTKTEAETGGRRCDET